MMPAMQFHNEEWTSEVARHCSAGMSSEEATPPKLAQALGQHSNKNSHRHLLSLALWVSDEMLTATLPHCINVVEGEDISAHTVCFSQL